ALGTQVTERFMWTPERISAALAASSDDVRALCVAKAHQGVRHALAGQAAESLLLGGRWRLLADDDAAVALAYLAAAYPEPGARVLDGWALSIEWRRVRGWLREHTRHVR